MAEADLQRFLDKVRQLQAFVALSEADPALREALRDCSDHDQVVALAAVCGFSIGRRWGETDTPAVARTSNLLAGPCPPPGQEQSMVLLERSGLRLERIHSCSAATPAGHWYDQSATEWVLLLRGSARLRFEDDPQPLELAVGDTLLISPHRRHRVEGTDPAPGTLWLALFVETTT
ncbi:Nif11 domain/cupin domain-containing protein [Cyanobium sp. Morenito 9A2]|uniref:Nif11 domain/cupin domain-containing protein n=1 Tax=Cyanobium sp. Morenito 9A2 TaxID=2823718 RepID=UPI0020CE8A94|nr:Nif11 domain/cupin domain-containing protein [Cyanobium sp. Morenito 9A2]MCP9848458.1 Nif11 domain/cupin domain-containing protein [Cyanobium sp. Morenito 9A2]